MLFIIKGANPGGFAQRLAESLDVKGPVWPVTDQALAEWEEALRGWPIAARDAILGCRYVDVDKVCGLILHRHHGDYPPPPSFKPEVGMADFVRWQREAVNQMLEGPYFHEVFGVACQMIESMDHPIVAGAAVGGSSRDSKFVRMLLFKYSRIPFGRILLKWTGGEKSTVLFEGREHAADEILSLIRRRPDGQIELPTPN